MKRTFQTTRKFLDAIDNINAGGCGLAALALYDAAKREGKKPKIVYLYHAFFEHTSWIHNHEFKIGKRKKAAPCSHVLIKINGKLWDSTGVVSKDKLFMYNTDEEITREHLIASVNNKGAWNEMFNRKKWLPEIQKFFKRGTLIKS